VDKVSQWNTYWLKNYKELAPNAPTGADQVLVVSNDLVNHTFSSSTVIPMYKTDKTPQLYPTQILYECNRRGNYDVGFTDDRYILMVHLLTTIEHEKLNTTRETGHLHDRRLKEQVRQAMRDYLGV